MSTSPVENVVIVGTGCAGLTAAIYAARANLNPLVLEGPLPGGQLTTTSEVENFPGFPAGVDGFQLMQNLREQATKFGARFEQTLVQSVDFSALPRKLICADRTVLARTVIISTGASPRMTGIPGEKELYGGKGVTTCATCDGAFYRQMEVAVIGGGDSAGRGSPASSPASQEQGSTSSTAATACAPRRSWPTAPPSPTPRSSPFGTACPSRSPG